MYIREYKSDFTANWISASDCFLETFNRPKAEEFPNADYIWGRRYTRTYFRRIFTVSGDFENAFCHFVCDNIFDIYLNGKLVSFEKSDTGKADICNFLEVGENLLMIRAYQTAVPESFTSAFTGGIRIEYANGVYEDIVSDASFENVRFIDFWQTEDPEGWEIDRDFNMDVRNQLIVSHLHAIALKRSCLFRKDFEISGDVVRAILYASALGCYEPHLNGKKVGEAYFTPSAIDKTKEFQSYDVTNMLLDGQNTLAAITGNGWYNCESWGALRANKPAVLMELVIEYACGKTQKVYTDGSWKVCESPLVDNDIQFGERYDARLERAGWDSPQCDTTEWHKAEELKSSPYTSLLKQNYPPVKATRILPVKLVRRISDNSALFDCGINVAGTVELAIRGAVRGQMIRISVSERLNDSGDLEIGAYGAPYYPQDSYPDGKAPYNLRNTNIYIAKGEGEEYYSPRFCYTGFRYVMVDGIAVDEADVHVREMHNDLPVVGNFESCDETVNRLWDAIKQTWLNNCYNGPTDCPTREKNFWTGDTMIFSHLACWYTDCEEFLSRWTDLGRKMTGPYGWEDEEYILPWTLYRFYGDKEILKTRYKSICDLVNRRRESAKGGYLPQNPYSCYNDWLNPTGENLSPSFFAHCWYLHMLDVVSQIAEAVGDDESKALWRSEFKSGKELFNKLYYNFTAGEYSEKIQSSAVLPLAWGLVPKGEEQRVADTLHGYLVKNDFKLTTGFQASRFILEVLTDHGYGEDAVKLLNQKEFPSWGYMIDSGATNITESWLAMNDPDKSISMCHFSLGAAFSWFFEYLGGIRINECGAGFERVVIEPHCFEMLGECRVTYMSKHGEIIVEWRFEDGRLVFNYTVPDGIEAVVRNPKVYKHSETLHGK